LRGTATFQQIGFKQPIQTGTIGDPESFHDFFIEDRFNYASIDLEVLYHLTKKQTSLYIIGGVRNNYLLSHKPNYKIELIKDLYPFNQLNNFNRYVFGWKLGLGAKLNKSVDVDLTFNRDITPALDKPSLTAKNWFWSFNVYLSLKDLFIKSS